MKCCLCNNPAEISCSCIEQKLLICYKHMKSHIRESGSHVFEFLPKVLKHSISAKIKVELHFLKKNAIAKSSDLIGSIRTRHLQDLQKQNRGLPSEYLQRISSEISQIRETTRISLREIEKAIDSTKYKQENYELTIEFLEIIY